MVSCHFNQPSHVSDHRVICFFFCDISSLLEGSVNRLSFCRTNVLYIHFYDYGLIYRIACNDNSQNILLGKN